MRVWKSRLIYGIHEKKHCNSYLLLTNCKTAPTRLLHNWVRLWVEATPTTPAQIPVIVLVTTRPKHTHATSGSTTLTKHGFIFTGLVPKSRTIGTHFSGWAPNGPGTNSAIRLPGMLMLLMLHFVFFTVLWGTTRCDHHTTHI